MSHLDRHRPYRRSHTARNAAATTAVDSAISDAGDNALSSVEWLGSLVSKNSNQEFAKSGFSSDKDDSNIDGTGGSVYSNLASTIDADENKEGQVWAALANLEKDSKFATSFLTMFVHALFL